MTKYLRFMFLKSTRLPVDDWAFWDEQLGGWNLEKGRYDISIAAASDDIKYVVSVEIK